MREGLYWPRLDSVVGGPSVAQLDSAALPSSSRGDLTRSQYRVVETREYNFIYIMYIDTSEGGAEALRSLLTFLGICYFSIPAAPRTPYAKFNLEYFLSCPWPLMASLNEI